jgi:putative SOS response-associated peptidase YedK
MEYFEGLDRFPPRWNVAPTDTMPICRLVDGRPELVAAKWGLIPARATDPRIGGKKINAPCQNILNWAEYREPYRAMRRCLVPATGFYEWTGEKGRKQAYHLIHAEQELLAFAGLWGAWAGADGHEVLSFTILTTEPNDIVRPVKDRMPVVLGPADYHTWLTAEDATALLQPAHNEVLYAYAVGPQVGAVTKKDPVLGKVPNNDPSLIEPIEDVDRRYLDRDAASSDVAWFKNKLNA